jgi:acyl carrier protein
MTPLQQLQVIFRDIFDDPALMVTEKLSPLALPEWDSVAQVHIVIAVEAAFEMRFTTDEVAKISSVGDILQILTSRD